MWQPRLPLPPLDALVSIIGAPNLAERTQWQAEMRRNDTRVRGRRASMSGPYDPVGKATVTLAQVELRSLSCRLGNPLDRLDDLRGARHGR